MMTEPTWRKSSYSGEGNCVELSDQAGRVLVRDTQDRQGPVLTVPARAWREFVGQVQEANPISGPLASCSVERHGS